MLSVIKISVIEMALIVLIFLFIFIYLTQKQCDNPLPPSPRKSPVFGNLFQVNALRPYSQVHPTYFLAASNLFKLIPSYFFQWAESTALYSTFVSALRTLWFLTLPKLQMNCSSTKVNCFQVVLPTMSVTILWVWTKNGVLATWQEMEGMPSTCVPGWVFQVMRSLRNQTARRIPQSSISPGPAKRLRPNQDIESCVLFYDLIHHDDKGMTQQQISGPNGGVPEGHWFSLIRWYVILHKARIT